MAKVAKTIELRRIGNTIGFELLIDGEVFPWSINREPVEVTNLCPRGQALYEVRIGIFADQAIGTDEFNEQLLDEADSHRVRWADDRDLRIEAAA